jgi:hypothetical protein
LALKIRVLREDLLNDGKNNLRSFGQELITLMPETLQLFDIPPA